LATAREPSANTASRSRWQAAITRRKTLFAASAHDLRAISCGIRLGHAKGSELMKVSHLRKALLSLAATALLAFSLPCPAEPVSFRQAIDLALQHGGMLAISAASRQKAHDVYEQARAAYLPTIVFGSGLGYSAGIPPSLEGNAPSIFNVVSQQSLLNLAQRDFLRAAKNELQATHFDAADKRNAVILDTATAYLELDNALRKLKTLGESAQAASRAEFITTQRLQEGLDSQLDLKKAQLNIAKVNVRVAEAQATADVARRRLSRLTGLPAESIDTVSDSIPAPPKVGQDEELPARAAQNSPVVQLAQQRIVTAELRARGEAHALYPSIDLASQYERLSSTINNYAQFYKSFKPNSFAIGLSIRFPLTDFAQHAKANAALADVLRARQEAQMAHDQVAENTLQMQRGLRQLAAASEVARLEYEVTQAAIDAVRAKLDSGQANSRDQENARLDSSDRYSLYLDSQLQLARATMQLMRQTGDLEGWALPGNP
jgi:outer membrane protein TolC